MATEEAEVAEATQEATEKPGSGLGKTIGLGVGLFFLVVAAQFVTSIVGCLVLPGLMPGCTVHTDEPEVAVDGKKAPASPGKDAEPKAPPIYHAFDPPLVVSFQEQGTMRFLQVTVEVMARDEESIKAVQTHMPVLRNNLLNIFSGKGFTELTSRDGKESLRKECLAEVQRSSRPTPPPRTRATVEDLYFTSFVVQ